MKNIWKKNKSSIIIVGYILIMASFVYFVFIPSINKIKEKSDAIEERNIDGDMQRSNLGKLPDLRSDYSSTQKNQEAMDVILNPQDEVTFIKKIESLAKDTGNKISLKIDDEESAKNNNKSSANSKNAEKTIKSSLAYPNYISMQINLIGNYPNLLNFINKLENDSYYVDVISFKAQKEIEASDKNKEGVNSPNNNIFSVNNKFDQPNQTDKKEIINSTIDVIIYIKN